MPNGGVDLGQIRNAVIGQETKKGVVAAPSSSSSVVDNSTAANSIGTGTKLTFRKEHKLTDYIEVDFNPEKLPINYSAKYNDKAIVGGDDAIEWQGTGKREFPIELLFTDYGYHRKKGFKESVESKLDWLIGCITRPILQVIEDEAVTQPPIVFVEMGSRAFRAVIVKLDGYEEMQDKTTYDPIRAKVNVTVRVVRRKRGTKPPV